MLPLLGKVALSRPSVKRGSATSAIRIAEFNLTAFKCLSNLLFPLILNESSEKFYYLLTVDIQNLETFCTIVIGYHEYLDRLPEHNPHRWHRS